MVILAWNRLQIEKTAVIRCLISRARYNTKEIANWGYVPFANRTAGNLCWVSHSIDSSHSIIHSDILCALLMHSVYRN